MTRGGAGMSRGTSCVKTTHQTEQTRPLSTPRLPDRSHDTTVESGGMLKEIEAVPYRRLTSRARESDHGGYHARNDYKTVDDRRQAEHRI
jgi:hypothetical protein